jgi:adhesin transport system membrane fusion protein
MTVNRSRRCRKNSTIENNDQEIAACSGCKFFHSVLHFFKKKCLRKRKRQNLFNVESDTGDTGFLGLKDDVRYTRSTRVVMVVSIFSFAFFIWSYVGEIAEVTRGTGIVIPSQKEQVIQSLDGGILERINVREGDVVQAGQVVAELDTIRTMSSIKESQARYRAALATSVRLKAEINNQSVDELKFPDELQNYPDLISRERTFFINKRQKLSELTQNFRQSGKLINRELAINQELVSKGASSEVDVLRLQRQLVELHTKEEEAVREYYITASQELARADAEVQTLAPVIIGKRDLVNKSKIRSPVKGMIKSINISTLGGSIPPNGILMNIVPINDRLLIEAKISPRDIGFIRVRPEKEDKAKLLPTQKARVKITAYDYSIYGGLEGEVVFISPDSTKDEHKPGQYYYKVFIQTYKDYMETKSGRKMYISPGMMATVEITTGKRTVLQYLIKPFNKLNEAMRER